MTAIKPDYHKSIQVVWVFKAIRESENGLTKPEIAEKCCVAVRSLDLMTRVLRECGLIHIGSWRINKENGYEPKAVFVFGPGEDAPKRAGRPNADYVNVRGSRRADQILDHIKKVKRATARECAMALGMHETYASRLARNMRKEGLVHVDRWILRTGQHIPVYAIGAGKDAPYPKPKTKLQIQRDRKRRLEAQYGFEIANRIRATRREGGAERIVIDGKTVYQRGQPRGKKA